MDRLGRHGWVIFGTGAAMLLAVAVSAWQISFRAALEGLAERGRAELSLTSGQLESQLLRHRELAVLMADHPAMRARLSEPEGTPDFQAATAGHVLRTTADKTGVPNIVLLDVQGRVQAAADPELAARADYAQSPYFARAMDGALGTFHAISANGQRTFSFAAPIFGMTGAILGAVVVVADVESTESGWRDEAQTVFFSDTLGVVFLANRSELVLRQRGTGFGNATAAYDPGAVQPFPALRGTRYGDHVLWRLEAGPYVPDRALYIERPIEVFALTGASLVDLAPALRLAGLQTALATGATLSAFALFVALSARRRRMAERLSREAGAKQAAEDLVALRTRDLSRANARLRQEVREREETAAELRTTQARLVQAAKLSALGEMSAGISHELNQPLMAIQSYAENTELLLERGRTDTALDNAGRISDLARRMARIIRNLRAFARQEDAPLTAVDPAAVVAAALEIGAANLRAAGVAVDWMPPDQPVRVRAGEVRLQQVVLNLVANAADAMAGQPDARIEIRLGRDGQGAVVLSVRDTGPGLADPNKVFDPFYTTKVAGGGDSMGLGLSISYGLVQSFGGDIEGRNHPERGAIFTVRLPPLDDQVAA